MGDRLKRYPRLIRLTLIIFGLWGVHEVLTRVIWRNALANLYPPEADSIGIPDMGHLLGIILALPFYLTIALLPDSGLMRLRPDGRRWWQFILMIWIGLSYLIAVADNLGVIANWSDQHHYPIALAGGTFLLLLLCFLWRDVRRFKRAP